MKPQGLACREKYWYELDQDQKIERLRKEVEVVQSLINRIIKLEVLSKRHTHDKDGNVIVKVDFYRSGEGDIDPRGCHGCEECAKRVRI